MLTNKVSPSGLNVAPANSLPLSTFNAKSKISPCCVNPRRNCSPPPSSQRINPPPGVTVMLSGASRTSSLGDSKTSDRTPPEAPCGLYFHTCPSLASPPSVELKNKLPSPYQIPSSLEKLAAPPA